MSTPSLLHRALTVVLLLRIMLDLFARVVQIRIKLESESESERQKQMEWNMEFLVRQMNNEMEKLILCNIS